MPIAIAFLSSTFSGLCLTLVLAYALRIRFRHIRKAEIEANNNIDRARWADRRVNETTRSMTVWSLGGAILIWLGLLALSAPVAMRFLAVGGSLTFIGLAALRVFEVLRPTERHQDRFRSRLAATMSSSKKSAIRAYGADTALVPEPADTAA